MINMKMRRFVMGTFATNCYLVWNEKTKEGFVIDPEEDIRPFTQAVEDSGIRLTAVLLTHGHFDHILGAEELRTRYGIPVLAHADEKELLGTPAYNLSATWSRSFALEADEWLLDGQVLLLAGSEVRVIHTPGHTPGGVCFYLEAEKCLFSGDTLFEESLGRTDFPLSSTTNILSSIRQKLMCLPDDVTVYPGHEEATTIGHERLHNPAAV